MSTATKNFEGHTPGPWQYARTGNQMQSYSQPFGVCIPTLKTLVCGCFGDIKGGVETAEANAKLIASAPDLLSERDSLAARVKELEAALEAKKGTVTIEILGGCLTDVSGLPEGWDYELIDYDNLEAEADSKEGGVK